MMHSLNFNDFRKLSEADPLKRVCFFQENVLVEISFLINKDAAIFKIEKSMVMQNYRINCY